MKFIVMAVVDPKAVEIGKTVEWNGVHIEVVAEENKINPEQFGDWIRKQREEYLKLLGAKKLGILVL